MGTCTQCKAVVNMYVYDYTVPRESDTYMYIQVHTYTYIILYVPGITYIVYTYTQHNYYDGVLFWIVIQVVHSCSKMVDAGQAYNANCR